MTTFHSFPRLPYELRMHIWELTVQPRTIHIDAKSVAWGVTSKNSPQYLYYAISSTPVPATLHVCRETRKHGLYQKGFSELAHSSGAGLQYIWVNWDLDTIDVGLTPFECFHPIAHLFQRIKFERSFQEEGFFHWEAHEIGEHFKNLKEIYVVCAEPCGPIDWLYAFDGSHHWPCGYDNMYFIDKSSGQMFKGEDGLDEIERLHELKLAESPPDSRDQR